MKKFQKEKIIITFALSKKTETGPGQVLSGLNIKGERVNEEKL